ncbi:DUF6497 family protein [Litoreibacter roseus]|uniref:DUF6497 family protein n=1 Tax=Litoreibacter roseus TaxID=2601869 RepID=UPI001356E4E1|nr:DUF6497 family protein [Litoreibacter roseus]
MALGFFLGATASVAEDAIKVPSGAQVVFQEMRIDDGGGSDAVLRVRYVAPQIADTSTYGFDVIEPDLSYLCETHGLLLRSERAPDTREIVISIASEPIAFGETTPEVVQYFDVFRVDSDHCIWSGL